jgi:3-oxoacyl-[acyl-carrier-protein] synthase II
MNRRVVITGIGVLTPLGDEPSMVMDQLMDGHSAIGPITRFDTTGFPPHTAAQIAEFDPPRYGIGPRDVHLLDIWQQYAVAAAELAVRDAGLDLPRNDISALPDGTQRNPRYGACLGSAYLSGEFLREQIHVLRDSGFRAVSPRLLTSSLPNGATSAVSIRYGLCGPLMTVSSSSAAGSDCVIAGYDKIMLGRADVMLAGGAEAGVSALTVAAMSRIGSMSLTGVCRPFDRERDGMVIGEGAAVLVLEEYEHARRRDARIHGEVLGYGQRGDAHHLTQIPAEAPSQIDCIHEALHDAGIQPGQVGYVNVHGTATHGNDLAEAHALRAVFGTGPDSPLVSGVKGATGHMGGGSGPFELIVSLLACARGQAPPTAGLTEPAEDCALRHIIGKGTDAGIGYAMSVSNGLGGNSAAIVVRANAG